MAPAGDDDEGIPEDRRGRPRSASSPVLSLAELEAIRLVLRGGSVVDWYRLNFDGPEDVDRLARVLGAKPELESDLRAFDQVRVLAADYLATEQTLKIPEEILECHAVDLFLYAAELKGRRKDRYFACLLLKVMHIVHHIRARELRYRLPLSNSELAQLLIRKVDGFVDDLAINEFPLVEYVGGEKSFPSMVTKLLVKKQHHAAAIRDRVRFRFVVERQADLVPLLHRMTRDLIPFNYIVPGQTVNQLVNFTALVESHESYRQRAQEFQVEFGHEDQVLRPVNEFSGPTYRVINFVADIPIRVPSTVLAADESLAELGPVIFGLAEFQVVDAETHSENETGDNAHPQYKDRQKHTVRERLARGLRGLSLDGGDT